MTVIVQPPTDSNGNPQPMVYDQDTGKVIVDSNGFIVSGGQRLVNVPSKADYVSTTKTQTAGIIEAHAYAQLHKGTVIKITAGNSGNGSPYYIDIPLTIGQTDSETVIWEFEGFVSIHPSNNFTAGQPMIIVGNSNLPSPDIHMYGQRVQINGFNPSGTVVASSGFSFQGLGDGQPAYYFTFEKCQMNGFQSGGSLIENTGISERSVIMRGIVYQGNGYDFFNSSTGAYHYFIDCTISGAVNSIATAAGGGGIIYIIRGTRPNSVNLSSTGGENILVFEDSGILAGGGFPLLQATGYSAEFPANILFYGDNELTQMASGHDFLAIGDYVNIFAENIRFTLDTSSGTSYIINPTSGGPLNGNIYLGKVRVRSLTSGSTLEFAVNSNAITQNKMIEAFIVEEATGTVVNPYPPSTPSVPASGTAQQNTNSYPVDVYLYGGTVTEIQITKNGTAYTVFSNSTGLALSGQAYKLNPGDSITVTYTAAPSWEWLSD